jgi:hypothetical protein
VLWLSRPFSYNDENFTVMGNTLFVHVDIGTKKINKGGIICTIPPAIYDRLVTYNSIATISNRAKLAVASQAWVYVDNDRNIITNVDIAETSYPPRLAYTWFLLKDI